MLRNTLYAQYSRYHLINALFYPPIPKHLIMQRHACYRDNSKNLYYYMPQLVPFFFVNQVVFSFTILVLLIYVFSKYILPKFVRLFAARTFISKL